MTKSPPVVIVIDDEQPIRRFLRAGFELEGFVVHDAASGAAGLRIATLRPADLVILDLALPDMDGAEVLARLRAWSSIPIIVLSVKSGENEKVRLLELGADDYVVKPFSMIELIARARAALRRQIRGAVGEPIVRTGALVIDFATRTVTLDGCPVQLSGKEYRLLQVLAQHAGNVVTHQQLLREVWGETNVGNTHYLRIFIRKLRHKIESVPTQPNILLTELGVGYRLASATDTEAASAGRKRH
jgi:two-component system KDP operon response regulator KdpE